MLANLALLMAVGSAQPQASPALEKPELICREGEQQLGSHMRTSRRCKTAEEWRQEDLKRDQMPTTMRITDRQRDALTPKTRPQ